MDSGDENVEHLNVAIKRLIEERKKRREISGDDFDKDDDDDEQILLSRLLSQLESSKADRALHQPEASKEETKTDNKNVGEHEIDKEEIVKELNKVKKQNSVTQWLLSIMIVLTVAWQVSEVSLILKLKEGVSHPFRSLGSMLTGMFRGQGGKNEAEDKLNHVQAPPLPPPLKIPEIPHVELPDISADGNRH